MTSAELVKALRCEYYGDDECDNSDCPIWSELGCCNGIANHADANVIEAADNQSDEDKAVMDCSYCPSADGCLEAFSESTLCRKLRRENERSER